MAIQIVKNIEDYKLDIVKKDVDKICAPLFMNTKISFFEYDRAFLDYSRITITSNPEWVYNYYHLGYYANGMHHRSVKSYVGGYNCWNSVGRNSVTTLARDKFNIDNGFTIIEPSINICEFYHFASYAGERDILNFYFNNINILYRFIAYFKCNAQDIIAYCLMNKIEYVNGGEREDIIGLPKHVNIDTTLPITKFYFCLNGNYNYLTNREIDISSWLLKGKSAIEISVILNISSKTVEAHIEHIKIKLACYKQTQIITQLVKIGLTKIINV